MPKKPKCRGSGSKGGDQALQKNAARTWIDIGLRLTGCCGQKQDHKRGELEHDVITILSKTSYRALR